MEKSLARIIGIARHRLSTDGDDVTTLIAFHGCLLRCRYYFILPSFSDGNYTGKGGEI